jgi:two-component system nitrogen regulation response regulator GlnG
VAKSVLIIDDEQAIAWTLQRALAREGYDVRTASSAEQGLALADTAPPDVVILDVRLPGMDGLAAQERLRVARPDLAVIVMTAYGSLDTAVRAVAGGAFDYLLKPFDLQQALDAVARALVRPQLTSVAGGEDAGDVTDAFIGKSPALQAVFRRIALAAPRDTCVLITGESGTGKELVARAIHRHSPRRERPFFPVHIAGLNDNLVESELFGHVRGAFTGATAARDGLLTLAEGGTILLDEIGDVPLHVQVKLLRALEHNEILPVGGNRPLALNLRMLAATHQDLGRLVAEGRFREDLFFRLNVFSIHLPPLRERREDIPVLAEYFLRRDTPHAGPLVEETVAYLLHHPWPGNVRELRNSLQHAAIVAHQGPILPEHFPLSVRPSAAASTAEHLTGAVRRWTVERISAANGSPHDLYDELLRSVEPALLDEVLRRVRGNRWEAARQLGLNRATVRKKLSEYGLADAYRNDATDPPV